MSTNEITIKVRRASDTYHARVPKSKHAASCTSGARGAAVACAVKARVNPTPKS